MALETRLRSPEEEERLISDNIRLVWYHLKKFNRLADQDAQSAAMEGLWKAARTFDGSKGAAFGTYASVCIYNALGMYLRKIKRISDHEVTSLDKPFSDDFTFADSLLIADEHTPESVFLASEAIIELRAAFNRLLDKTTSVKCRDVITMWYTSGGTLTQMEIAKATGFSQSYVSRVISSTKHKIRQELEGYV